MHILSAYILDPLLKDTDMNEVVVEFSLLLHAFLVFYFDYGTIVWLNKYIYMYIYVGNVDKLIVYA